MATIPHLSCDKYRYGKITKRLENAVQWINDHFLDERRVNRFDFPDYWGMPKKISHKLSPDEVDYIQEITSKLITK